MVLILEILLLKVSLDPKMRFLEISLDILVVQHVVDYIYGVDLNARVWNTNKTGKARSRQASSSDDDDTASISTAPSFVNIEDEKVREDESYYESDHDDARAVSSPRV